MCQSLSLTMVTRPSPVPKDSWLSNFQELSWLTNDLKEAFAGNLPLARESEDTEDHKVTRKPLKS